jgi:hypothetical protein
VRVLLCEAANALLTRVSRWSWVKRWGLEVLKRRGKMRAQIAVARRLAVIMHRMWLDGTELPLATGAGCASRRRDLTGPSVAVIR